MAILVIPVVVFTLVTLVLVARWRLGLWLFRPRAPGFWRRALRWHAGLFALHLFVTVPVLLGVLISRGVGTRRDEAAYGGPRLGADGTWLEQTRDSLAAEQAGTVTVEFLRARPEAKDRPLVLHAVSLGIAAVAIAAPRIPELGGLVLDAPIDDLGSTALRELRSGGPAVRKGDCAPSRRALG